MKRNKFNLSFTKLLTCDMGELVPIACVEVLPGDTFQHSTQLLLRCSPLLSPVMHPVSVRIHHWFVPTRIIWSEFEDFMTGGPDGLNSAVPPNRTGTFSAGLAMDYFDVPPGVNVNVSTLPLRAYNTIWNEYYRDQDLEAKQVVNLGSGTDGTTAHGLWKCSWEKDYFTSSRPWEQKGPAVTIPIGSEAAVAVKRTDTTGALEPAETATVPAGAANTIKRISDNAAWATDLPLYADLSNASAVTVTLLREALALQRWEENRARFGSRYSEFLRSWGVASSDARLNRPEYLGGGKQTIQFSEVLQVGTNTADNNGVGTMRGHGIAAMRSNRYRKFFEEHGYVISLLSVVPKTIYASGIRRSMDRRTRDEWWHPEYQHIGQQEIRNKEIYAAHAQPDGVFGYQDRYDEYRRIESSIAGEFRTSTLDFWHFARIFSSAPALNAAFVSATPTERVFAVPSVDNLYIQAKHNIRARRFVAPSGKSFIK